MTFLSEKLSCMKQSARMQRTLLCTWLTELHLDKLNSLESTTDPLPQQEHLEKFRKFLSEHKEDLDRDGGSTAEVQERLFFRPLMLQPKLTYIGSSNDEPDWRH